MMQGKDLMQEGLDVDVQKSLIIKLDKTILRKNNTAHNLLA